MANNNHYELTNLMIPAFGTVRTVVTSFNPANSYSLDVNTLLIEQIPFRPQSVTIDCTDVPDSESVEFVIRQINFSKRIRGGNTVTFNFPSIPNMVFDVTPSDNLSEVRAFWYNFPSFPDLDGVTEVVSAGGSGTQDVNVVSPDPLPVSIGGGGALDVNIVTPVTEFITIQPSRPFDGEITLLTPDSGKRLFIKYIQFILVSTTTILDFVQNFYSSSPIFLVSIPTMTSESFNFTETLNVTLPTDESLYTVLNDTLYTAGDIYIVIAYNQI